MHDAQMYNINTTMSAQPMTNTIAHIHTTINPHTHSSMYMNTYMCIHTQPKNTSMYRYIATIYNLCRYKKYLHIDIDITWDST